MFSPTLPDTVENPTFWENSDVNIWHYDTMKVTHLFVLKKKLENLIIFSNLN